MSLENRLLNCSSMNVPNRKQLKPSRAKGQAANVIDFTISQSNQSGQRKANLVKAEPVHQSNGAVWPHAVLGGDAGRLVVVTGADRHLGVIEFHGGERVNDFELAIGSLDAPFIQLDLAPALADGLESFGIRRAKVAQDAECFGNHLRLVPLTSGIAPIICGVGINDHAAQPVELGSKFVEPPALGVHIYDMGGRVKKFHD